MAQPPLGGLLGKGLLGARPGAAPLRPGLAPGLLGGLNLSALGGALGGLGGLGALGSNPLLAQLLSARQGAAGAKTEAKAPPPLLPPKKPREETTAVLEMRDVAAGTIIGRGGENLKAVEMRTSCKFTFGERQNTGVRSLTLRGTAEAVAAAKRAVDEVLEGQQGSSPEDRATANVAILLRLDAGQLSQLAGASVKRVEAATTCRVALLRDTGLTTREVRVTGPRIADVDDAQRRLEELMAAQKRVGATLTLREEQIPLVVGRAAETLTGIEEQTGCRLELPRAGADGFREVAFKGDDVSVAAAVEAVERVLHDETDEVEDFVPVGSELAKDLQRKAEREYGVRMQLVGGVVRIRGPEAAVHDCARALTQWAVRSKLAAGRAPFGRARSRSRGREEPAAGQSGPA